MYKDLIKNYQSPTYIKAINTLNPKNLGNDDFKILSTHFKTLNLAKMEENVQNLIQSGKTEEAIILGLELDEYLTFLDLPCKFLYQKPLMEEIHKEKLKKLDFYDKINQQFKYLYSKSKYSFDKETEDLILARLDNYIFTSNSEQYHNEVVQLFSDNPIFRTFDFKKLETYYSDYLKMKITIKNANGDLTSYIKSIDDKSKIAFIKNQFYDSNESKIINTLNHIEKNLSSELPNEFMKKVFEDVANNKKNQQAYFSFKQLPDILSSRATVKISKSEIYRDLFPFFQITHPAECLNETDWEKQRGGKVFQSYKSYQRDKVKSLLGL